MMQLPAETAIGTWMRFYNGSGGHFSNLDAYVSVSLPPCKGGL
jgi:hypothetical protein